MKTNCSVKWQAFFLNVFTVVYIIEYVTIFGEPNVIVLVDRLCAVKSHVKMNKIYLFIYTLEVYSSVLYLCIKGFYVTTVL